MTVWRCSNCKYRLVDEKKNPCKSCDGKSKWKYHDPQDIKTLMAVAIVHE